MRAGVLKAALPAILAGAVAGCATNTIRLDRATTMGSAGEAATEGTTKALDTLKATNRDVLIDLAALDQNCALPNPTVMSGPGDGLCRSGLAQPGDRAVQRWTARELKPSLAVIEGIATYLGAIDAIVSRKPVDIGADVAGAEEKLRAVADDLAVVAGTPGLPAVNDDQRKAVLGTLDLLSELVDEAGRVRDLRRLELGRNSGEFDRSLAALAGVNEAAVSRITVQLDDQRALLREQLRRMAKASPEARRPVATRMLDVIDARAALPELHTALRGSVDAFDRAHTDYRDLLLGRGTLTSAERRKAASVTEARVLAALHSLASIVKAF